MNSPSLIGFLAAASVLLIYLGIMRASNKLPEVVRSESIMRSLNRKLQRAGITSITAPAMFFAGLCLMAVVLVVSLFAFRSVPISVLITAAVPLFISLDLDRRARKYQEKLAAVLVPFLRKIISQVRVGINPTQAFATAVNEDKLLSYALREQLADLKLHSPFRDVLRSTVTAIPLRPWVQFVRSVEVHSRDGGELAEILENNVGRIQSQVLMRKRLMGDAATYRGQQIIILGFAISIPAALFVMGPELFGTIATHPAGLLACVIAAGMDGLALWMTSRAINRVESKLET